MRRRLKTSGLIGLLVLATLTQGCAILGGGDDPVVKAEDYTYSNPEGSFEKVSISSADAVWQSRKTGNTIAVNSMCQKYVNVSLTNLQNNILAGIEDLEIIEESQPMFNRRRSKRVLAKGNTDGVPIQIDLLTLKKNTCTFDIAYIGRTKTFENERTLFSKFLQRFKVP